MKRLLIGLMAVAVLWLPGCAKARHVAVVVDAALYEALNDVHSAEQTVLCGEPSCAGVPNRVTAQWTDAKSQGFNQKLLPAVSAGRQFNTVLGNWEPGTPVPEELHDIITGLSSSLAVVVQDLPGNSPQKARLVENIAKAQSIALTVLDLVLTVKGR